jgi:tetratricopeptide (TPR) repeat protein
MLQLARRYSEPGNIFPGMMYIKLILALFLVNSAPLLSQSRDELISKGIDQVYRMQFDSAGGIFQLIINQNPKDPTGYFFQSMKEWWKIYINKDDESNDENYRSIVDVCINVCDQRLDDNEEDDWALLLKGGVIGYRGFLNSIRERWLQAVDDGREGLGLIQRSYELNPNNKDAIFGIGLYNYAADYVTDKYPFLKTLLFFFPKGNKELGLSQLRDCAENARFSRTEANFVLCYVNLAYEKNYYEAEKYAGKIFKLYPENPVAERFLGRSYIGLGKWNESIELWRNLIAKCDSSKTGYNNKPAKREGMYYLGLSLMKAGNLDEALKCYQQAIELSREIDKDGESAHQVFATLGVGMIYDIKGNHAEAVKYYDRVIEMNEIEYSRESARKFKEEGYK